ncbi:MAG: acetylxylan esterase [Verrucomicrobiia bacterium]
MNPRRFSITLAAVVIFGGLSVRAQDNFNALPWRMTTAYNAYLLREVHTQYAERQLELADALLSRRAMEKYRDDARERYRAIIGDLPQKTDLNLRVTGTSQQKGFRIEKIVFESVPHRHVTADLYIPEGKGPFPATLVFCGHAANGKVGDQREALTFVRNGFVVFVVDPVGQGERFQLTDATGKDLTRGATTEHTLLNTGLNLVGTGVAACEFWDNVRALDYLESRPEVDKDRIGCIGSSGGGTQAAYFIGLEPRIKVAVVCSYVSERERTLELSGPSDGCQHIPYEGREHLEIGDFLLMMAPKPVYIMSGYYDFVDYWGAARTFAELKRVYAALGEPEKVGMFSLEGGHGMPKPKREAAVTWFRTWLCNDRTPVHESDETRLTEKELNCTPTGQINTSYPDEITLPRYASALSRDLGAQRSAFLKNDRATITARVLELLGVSMPTNSITVENTGSITGRDYPIRKLQIIRHGEMPVPCLVVYPETVSPTGCVVVCLNEGGKAEIASNNTTIASHVNRGDILVLCDLRGFGETTDPSEWNDPKYWNREYRNAMISMHIGRPIMGQRVADVMSVMDFVSSDPQAKAHPIKLVANGVYGPVAIHAAYLDPRINDVEITGSIRSFNDLVDNPLQHDAYSSILYGVLKYYDLSDLMNMTGNRRIRFLD